MCNTLNALKCYTVEEGKRIHNCSIIATQWGGKWTLLKRHVQVIYYQKNNSLIKMCLILIALALKSYAVHKGKR